MVTPILIEFTSDVSQLEPAFDSMVKLGQIDASTAEAFKKSNAELAKRAQVVKTVTAEEQKQIKTIDDLAKATAKLANSTLEEAQQGIADALAEAGVSAKELTDAVTKLDKSEGSLKQQLRAMTEELALMETQGKRNTAEYNELVAKAGELKDAVGDASDAIANAGSDTRGIDNVISLAGGVAGGFAIAQGAAALFGSESEEVQKVLVRVSAAMAILQGLQQIQDLMSKRQFASLSSLLGLQKAQVANTIVQTEATGAQIIATEVQTAATVKATVATRIWNAVLALNPLTLLITAVAAATAAIAYFSSNSDKAAEAQKKLTAEIDDQNASLETMRSLYDELNSELDRNTQLSVARAKARGATEQDILGIEQEGLRQRIANMQAEQNQLINSKHYTEETSKRYRELTSQILDAQTKLRVDSLNNQTEQNKELTENQKKADDKRKDQQEKAAKESEDIAKRNSQALFEIEQRKLQRQSDSFKKSIEGEPALYKIRVDALYSYAVKQEEILNLQKKQELNNSKLTSAERLNIENKYAAAVLDLNAEVRDKKRAIELEYSQILRDVLKDRSEEYKKQKEDQITNAAEVADKEHEARMERARDASIAQKKEFEDAEALEKKHQEKKAQIKQAGLELASQAVSAFFDLENASRRASVDAELSRLQEQRSAELSNKNLTEQQKEDIDKKYRAKEREIKLRAWKADQDAAAKQAVIQGLLAFAKALPNFILAGAALLAAGIQVAAIKSQKPPQFKKGGFTGNKGIDEPAGIVHGQEFVINAEATKRNRPMLEAINSLRFDEYINSLIPHADPNILSNSKVNGGGQLKIDYKTLGKEIAKNVPSPVQNNLSIDKNGLDHYIIEAGNRTRIRNQRYKTK